jgi:hypothetical protein
VVITLHRFESRLKPLCFENRRLRETLDYQQYPERTYGLATLTLVVRRNHRIPLSSGACDTAACARGSVLK